MDPPVSSNEPMINMINLSKASRVLSDPMFYVMLVPFSLGCVGLKVFFSKVRVNAFDRGMMVWWHASCFFFYTHCDILSGYYGVMPGMAEQYIHSAPPLRYPRWAPERFHFDVVFFLDIILQCPLAIFVILSYLYQHPGRYFAEVFAAAAQLFGTALYYTPHILFPEENRDFLQWMDLSLGAAWFVYPLLILRRRFLQAEEEQRKAEEQLRLANEAKAKAEAENARIEAAKQKLQAEQAASDARRQAAEQAKREADEKQARAERLTQQLRR